MQGSNQLTCDPDLDGTTYHIEERNGTKVCVPDTQAGGRKKGRKGSRKTKARKASRKGSRKTKARKASRKGSRKGRKGSRRN